MKWTWNICKHFCHRPYIKHMGVELGSFLNILCLVVYICCNHLCHKPISMWSLYNLRIIFFRQIYFRNFYKNNGFIIWNATPADVNFSLLMYIFPLPIYIRKYLQSILNQVVVALFNEVANINPKSTKLRIALGNV